MRPVTPSGRRTGKWIVFVAHPSDGSENVNKVRPDGTGLTNLTKQKAGGYHYLSSSFSPDGELHRVRPHARDRPRTAMQISLS